MIYCVCGVCYERAGEINGACQCGSVEFTTCLECARTIGQFNTPHLSTGEVTGVQIRSMQQNVIFGSQPHIYGCLGYCQGAGQGIVVKLRQMHKDSQRHGGTRIG